MSAGSPRQFNPVRRIFEVSDRCFNISGRLEPASVRDQMVRARLIVDRAHSAGLISPHNWLAVVGAGAAGVTAALRAAERYQVPVSLFERQRPQTNAGPPGAPPREMFHLQWSCASRLIDPTLYDWPALHWAAGRFPWRKRGTVALPWRGAAPDRLAARWQSLSYANPAAHRIFRLDGAKVEDYDVTDSQVTIFRELDGVSGWDSQAFGAVIIATGQGQERTWPKGERPAPGQFCGLPFWHTDGCETSDYNIASPCRILLSGSGDGALQDLCRLVLRDPDPHRSPLNPKWFVYAFKRIALAGRSSAAWDSFVKRIAYAEDEAGRARRWAPYDAPSNRFDRTEERALCTWLGAQYDAALTRLLGTTGLSADAEQLVRDWLRPELARGYRIDMAFEGPHFSHCFPINRLLGQIVRRYFDGLPGPVAARPVRFLDAQRLDAVSCIEHHYDPAMPEACWGQEHLASFSAGALATYHGVIIRHGIADSPTALPNLPAVELARQHMPLHPHN